MRTTLAFDGVAEIILGKAVDVGLARSRTEALRMGIFALNREYSLVKDVGAELAAKKMQEEENQMKAAGEEYIPEKEALRKYR